MAKENGNNFLTFLTGAAIGVSIGILYAPKKGSKTRDKIKQKAFETKHEWESRISHAYAELTNTADAEQQVFHRNLESALTSMSHKGDDIIANLELKLKELQKKNEKFKK